MSLMSKMRPDCEDLKSWAKENEPSNRMVFKNGYWNQIVFICERLFQFPFWKLADNAEVCKLTVIGSHISKSIVLPVCKIEYVGRGCCNDVRFEMIVSNNFHLWSVTVRCNYAISDIVKTLKLFDTSKSSYLYGFSSEDCLGSYDENQREFSCTINNQYEMWAFMRVITTKIEVLAS